MLVADVCFLKYPGRHAVHLGWAVAVPTALVYLPGGHLVWAVHALDLVLLGDGEALKNPGTHVSHL